MRLYLVRHGEASDTGGRCIGHTDMPLSEGGAAAIARAAEYLDVAPARIVASDLARARASAGVFAQRWQCPAAEDARLREMHFGAWEGAAWDDLERHDGRRLNAWMADWVRARAPEGESFEDVVARAHAWLVEAYAVWPDDTVVVVAHAGSIRALLCLVLAMPLDWAFRLPVGLASVSAVTIDRDAAQDMFARPTPWCSATNEVTPCLA